MADVRDEALRGQLQKILDWEDAHVSFDSAVEGVPLRACGLVPEGMDHSLWQLVDHLRRAQHDILEFCRNSDYAELSFPDDYWPSDPAPPSEKAWEASIAAVREDVAAFKRLAADPSIDLFARIPHGSGQTYLRELLLAADHNAYHVGQIVLVRRQLGIWKTA